MKPNPKRPYKAVAAAIIAGAGVAIAQGADILPAWVILVLAVLIAGLGTFLVPNPPADE